MYRIYLLTNKNFKKIPPEGTVKFELNLVLLTLFLLMVENTKFITNLPFGVDDHYMDKNRVKNTKFKTKLLGVIYFQLSKNKQISNKFISEITSLIL